MPGVVVPTPMTATEDARREGSGDLYRYRVPPGRSVTETVVAAVAEATGLQAGAGGGEVLDPLYDVVDPDALDALFRRSDPGGRSSGTVTFTYSGYEVTVEGGTVVAVAPE